MRNTHWKGPNHIPEGILVDILLRLPMKSLGRFMCVCKSWKNLIRSSGFVDTHTSRNVTKHGHNFFIALHCNRGKRNICYSLFYNETFEECLEVEHPLGITTRFQIYGSSYGLVCLSDNRLRRKSTIFLMNPSIDKYLSLPMTSIPLKIFCKYSIVLAFGFHPGLNDYKVVRIVSSLKKNSMEVEVYSLNTNSWKRIGVAPSLVKTMWGCPRSAFLNGAAYWITSNDAGTLYLVSFDTGSEVFKELLLPDPILMKGHPLISMYKESIFLLQRYVVVVEEQVDIWVLQEESFIKLHTVVLPGIDFSPLGFSSNNELFLTYSKRYRCEYDSSLALYNLESKQVYETGISLVQYYFLNLSVYTYTESLVLA